MWVQAAWEHCVPSRAAAFAHIGAVQNLAVTLRMVKAEQITVWICNPRLLFVELPLCCSQGLPM